MNKQTFVLGAGFLLLLSACRKNDLQSNLPENKIDVVAATQGTSANWNSITNWTTSQNEKTTTYDVKISDHHLEAGVVGNGMVLVFMKRGNQINSLPFTETGKNQVYWHYQISNNTLQINGDVQGTADMSQVQFRHFILSPGKIKSLEEAGHKKIDLMTLSYDNAIRLLN